MKQIIKKRVCDRCGKEIRLSARMVKLAKYRLTWFFGGFVKKREMELCGECSSFLFDWFHQVGQFSKEAEPTELV